MSARQPFVPQRKAPSRVPADVTQTSNPHEQTDPGDTFRPNGLLADSSSNPNGSATPHHSSNSQDTLVSTTTSLGGIDRPLNISGFAKSKFGNARKSFEDASARARSPRPPLAQHSIRSPVPTGFFPGPSNISSIPPFRLPPGQPAFKPQSSTGFDDFSANKAHIPTLHPDLDDSDTMQATKLVSPPPPGFRRHVSSHSSLEKIREEPEEELNATAHAEIVEHGMHLHDDPGRHDMSRSGIYGTTYNSPEYDRNKQPLRRVNKRIERTDELESDVQFNAAKRPKMDGQENTQDGYKSDFGTPPPPPPFSLPTMRTPSPPPYMHHGQSEAPGADDHAIRRLLGHDLDAYASAHVSTYEASKTRWSECTIEEWKDGADEIANKFAGLIDFVKDHMSSKLKLYVALHSSLSAHRSVLAGREETLKGVRDSLVRDGDKVVSSKIDGPLGGDGVKERSE